jgi:hypothetical protein
MQIIGSLLLINTSCVVELVEITNLIVSFPADPSDRRIGNRVIVSLTS